MTAMVHLGGRSSSSRALGLSTANSTGGGNSAHMAQVLAGEASSKHAGSSPIHAPLAQPLDPAVCQKASRYAIRVYEEMSKRSELLKNTSAGGTAAEIALFERDEIMPHLGELLGKGGFNSVYALERIQVIHNEEDYPTQAQRQELVNPSSGTRPPRLAVKFLSDEAMFAPEEFCNGAADLLMEAKYLAALAAHPHPSIIRLHGMSAGGPAGFGRPERAGCFLIIDRLYDSLDRRIDVWIELRRRKVDKLEKALAGNNNSSSRALGAAAATADSSNASNASAVASARKCLQGLFLQRLLVAQDVASALRHLHSLNIIYRDLKPDNIGFDYEGRVKIFDFGLAKELDPLQKNEKGLYHMSGGTGSRRFMAPEVALSEPYNLAADMYSFSIVLWELLSLEKAFSRMSVEEHRERVLHNHERPELDRGTWSKTLCRILELCWKRSPFDRPSAHQVHRALRAEIVQSLEREFPGQAALERSRPF